MGRPEAQFKAIDVQPRAHGDVRLCAAVRRGRTRIDQLYQAGSAKALFPRTPAGPMQAVLLNTAGGVTGGDRFDWTITAQPGADVSVATQTAERIYRAQPGQTGLVTTRLSVGDGAVLRWLPQETIVFDHGALSRRLEVDLAADARVLCVESLVFGRAAMGETVRTVRLDDQWRIRRAGRLVFADALHLHGDAAAQLAGPGTARGGRAIATAVLAAPDADARLAAVRAALPPTAGASLVRDGVLVVRLIAADGFQLRRTLVAVLEILGGPLPNVWNM